MAKNPFIRLFAQRFRPGGRDGAPDILPFLYYFTLRFLGFIHKFVKIFFADPHG
jgi:hypothetical protein